MSHQQPDDIRPDWPTYWRWIASSVATRSTCNRAHIGAVIVDEDNHILSSGYNGSPPGEPHCIDPKVGCEIENGHCVRTVHAEMNAVIHATRSLKGARLYKSGPREVCPNCARVLRAAGVTWEED